MSQLKKLHSAEFKAQVAMAAIREDDTISELSSRFSVHATLIRRWKKEALAGRVSLFRVKQEGHEQNYASQIKELHAKIGQLTVERDFLEQASRRLGLMGGKK